MKQDLYFDFRDVFRIPRVALSGKKIWTHFAANVIGYIIFIIFSYIAMLVSGYSFGAIWQQYHFFPFPYDFGLTWVGWLLYFIGGLLWAIAYYFASLAVARITYKEFKGDFFYSSGDGWRFVKKHWHPLIFGPVSVIGIIVFFIVAAIIAALLGKIPYVGEFLFSLPYLLYFPVAIFVLYTFVVFAIVLTFAPAVVGTSEEDTLETVFQSYSLLWAQPWRLVTYETIWSFLVSVAFYIFGFVMTAGVMFISFVFGAQWLMGDKLFRMMESALFYLGGDSSVFYEFLNMLYSPFAGMGHLFIGSTSVHGTEAVATVFLALAIFVIIFIIISYLTALDSVGQTIIYLILRKKKDDENLLERKDEDELAEEEEQAKLEEDEDLDESEDFDDLNLDEDLVEDDENEEDETPDSGDEEDADTEEDEDKTPE